MKPHAYVKADQDGPRLFVVVCPDYTSKPMTRQRAEKWLADVEATGHCRHGHTIEPSTPEKGTSNGSEDSK